MSGKNPLMRGESPKKAAGEPVTGASQHIGVHLFGVGYTHGHYRARNLWGQVTQLLCRAGKYPGPKRVRSLELTMFTDPGETGEHHELRENVATVS